MGELEDLEVTFQTGIDNLSTSVTNEIARVEALIVAGGVSPATLQALKDQAARLTAIQGALDAERP